MRMCLFLFLFLKETIVLQAFKNLPVSRSNALVLRESTTRVGGKNLLGRLKKKKLRRVKETSKKPLDGFHQEINVASSQETGGEQSSISAQIIEEKIQLAHEHSDEHDSSSMCRAIAEMDPLEDILEEGDLYLNERGRSVASEKSAPIFRSSNQRGKSRPESITGAEFDYEAVYELLKKRFVARFHKKFEEADKIRDDLEYDYGVRIFDRGGFWKAGTGESGSLKGYREEFLDKVYPVAPVECSLSEDEIMRKVSLRTQLRRAHNYEHADAIRDELAKAGVELMDKSNEWRTFDGKMGGLQSFDR